MSRWDDAVAEIEALRTREDDAERRWRRIVRRFMRQRRAPTEAESDQIVVALLESAACSRMAENVRIVH